MTLSKANSNLSLTRTKNRLVLIFIYVFFTSLITSCSAFNCTPLESLIGGETNLIKFSYKIADGLIDRSIPPLVPNHPDMPILVTTFVDNNNLTQTSQFGRILQEHIASRLVQLGYTVKEIKIADTMTIESKSGETILSRDLSRLSGNQQAQAILVGTLSRTQRTMYISTRLINPANTNIISSEDYKLCMDDNILETLGLRRQGDTDTSIEEPSQPFLNSIL